MGVYGCALLSVVTFDFVTNKLMWFIDADGYWLSCVGGKFFHLWFGSPSFQFPAGFLSTILYVVLSIPCDKLVTSFKYS
jgi:hypothetical protein